MIPRRTRNAALLAAALLLAPPAALHAQERTLGTPERAATAFFAAMERQQWAEAARWIHSDALASLRAMARERARSLSAPRPDSVTPEELMRDEPDMPRVVAEYQARKLTESMRGSEQIARASLGASSPEEVAAMPAAELFARLVAENDPRQMVQTLVQERGDAVGGELILRAVPPTVRTVIGTVSVRDRADAVYLVYTSAPRYPAPMALVPARTSVLNMRREGTEWRVDPGDFANQDLFGVMSFSFGFSLAPDGEPTIDELREPVVWPAQGTPRLRARMEGMGQDPLRTPPTMLVLEQLAADETVEARIQIPAEAWARLEKVVELWSLLLLPPAEEP